MVKPEDQARRAKFVEWFNGPPWNGDQAGFTAKLTGRLGGPELYTKGRVTQFFDKDEPFGEVAAKNLAMKVGLLETAFLSDASGGAIPASRPPPTIDEAVAVVFGAIAEAMKDPTWQRELPNLLQLLATSPDDAYRNRFAAILKAATYRPREPALPPAPSTTSPAPAPNKKHRSPSGIGSAASPRKGAK